VSAPVRPVTELPRTVPVGVARRTLRTVQRVRSHVIFGALLVVLGALLARLAHLQLLSGERFRDTVEGQQRTLSIQPLRGAIVDRQGRPLAISRPVRHVIVEAGGTLDRATNAIRPAIDDVGRFAATLAGLLEGVPSAAEIRERIYGRRRTGPFGASGSSMLPIRANVDDPLLIARLDQVRIRGLTVLTGDRRDYPNGSWAGALVGLAKSDDPWAPIIGRTGIEAGLDAFLTGVEVRRRLPVDGRGRRFVTPRTVDDRDDADGRTCWLALDVVIQGYCEEALDDLMAVWSPAAAVAIVMDPSNGDVLAMAQRPGFDATVRGPQEGKNYATQYAVEVGSTFKPLTAALALELGVTNPEEIFELPTQRTFTIGRATRTIHDAHEGEAGEPGTIVAALSHSNNPVFAELARRIGPERLLSAMKTLGVQRRIPLVGLPKSAEWVGRAPRPDRVGATDHLDWGFGHSFTMTPMRLAADYCAFARDDVRPVTPRLVLAVGGEAVPELRLGAPLVTSAARRETLRRGLEAVVTEGTGRETVLSPKFDIAGKTGTARKPAAFGADQYYSCSFVGYAPARAPRLVCLVMAMEPTRRADGAKPYGGAVAGPAVRRILEQALGEYLGLPARDGSGASPVAAVVPAAASTVAADVPRGATEGGR
jgi:cell division protein FtsI/penicillin-binding protein 2